MVRYRVRYHRAILDSAGAVKYPSGTIIDSLDMVDGGQHDKLVVEEDAAPAAAKRKVWPEDEDDDLEPE